LASEKGRMPLAFETDREALDAAFKTIGIWTPDRVKVAWICDARNLEWLPVSTALLESFKQEKSDLFDLPYDAEGNLSKLKDCNSNHQLNPDGCTSEIITETNYLIKIPSAYRPSFNSKTERIASCWGKKCCRISSPL